MIRRMCRILMALGIFCRMILWVPVDVYAVTLHLSMEVGVPGQKTASSSVGDPLKWYIRSTLPETWQEISAISVFQTLSPALTLDPSSAGLRLVQTNGEQILLRMEEHYVLTAGAVFTEEGTADRLHISLTREGMDFLEEYQMPGSQLELSYTAGINTCAPVGRQLLGSAQMTLTDRSGKKYIFLSDKAAAATGGFCVHLTDPTGIVPGEGSFMLAREASEKELEDDSVFKELLDTGTETLAVVYETFYTSRDMSGEKTDIAVTDEAGNAVCYGLAYGTYYLVQTETGHENTLASGPVRVEINEVSHVTQDDGWMDSEGNVADHTVRVAYSVLTMPRTGGIGREVFTISGLAIILCACLLLWYNHKRGYTA